MRLLGWMGALALLAGLLATSPTRPVRAGDFCPGVSHTQGYVTNGGFEAGYYGDGNDLIGEGWTRVNRAGTPNWTSTGLFNQVWNGGAEPEKIECDDSALITGGMGEAWKLGQPYDTVLYQRVTGLTPGQSYSFAGWILKVWGGTHPDARNLPRDPYSLGSWIGVDPTGGTDPDAPSVIWSEPDWDDEVDPKWANHRMAVVARGEVLTLFVRVQHKWEKDHTLVFVDAMELFDAPRATWRVQSHRVTEPQVTLQWSGELPQSLRERGDIAPFRLYSDVQQEQGEGNWVTIQTIETVQSDVANISTMVSVPEGQTVRLRILPYSYQRLDLEAGHWPPTTHAGLPTQPIMLSWDDPARLFPFNLFLPQVVK
jgi:hypothetical protein